MKLVGGGENDGFNLWVGQHRVIVAVGHAWRMNSGHTCQQVFSRVTDSV